MLVGLLTLVVGWSVAAAGAAGPQVVLECPVASNGGLGAEIAIVTVLPSTGPTVTMQSRILAARTSYARRHGYAFCFTRAHDLSPAIAKILLIQQVLADVSTAVYNIDAEVVIVQPWQPLTTLLADEHAGIRSALFSRGTYMDWSELEDPRYKQHAGLGHSHALLHSKSFAQGNLSLTDFEQEMKHGSGVSNRTGELIDHDVVIPVSAHSFFVRRSPLTTKMLKSIHGFLTNGGLAETFTDPRTHRPFVTSPGRAAALAEHLAYERARYDSRIMWHGAVALLPDESVFGLSADAVEVTFDAKLATGLSLTEVMEMRFKSRIRPMAIFWQPGPPWECEERFCNKVEKMRTTMDNVDSALQDELRWFATASVHDRRGMPAPPRPVSFATSALVTNLESTPLFKALIDSPLSSTSVQPTHVAGLDGVFIVHRNSLTDRRQALDKLLHAAGLGGTWLDKFDSEGMPPSVREHVFKVSNSSDPLDGAMANVWSQWAVLAHAVTHGWERVLIMEDDSKLTGPVKQLKGKIESALECGKSTGFDLLILSARDTGYVVSNAGARRMLEVLVLAGKMPPPMDVFMEMAAEEHRADYISWGCGVKGARLSLLAVERSERDKRSAGVDREGVDLCTDMRAAGLAFRPANWRTQYNGPLRIVHTPEPLWLDKGTGSWQETRVPVATSRLSLLQRRLSAAAAAAHCLVAGLGSPATH